MNHQMLEKARAAYRAGDYPRAAEEFAAAKEPQELAGEVDHLRGNALMRLGRFAEAAAAYESALQDTTYGKQGALLTNRGKALAAAGDYAAAAQSFTDATKDASYATPYKAYIGLGRALKNLNNPVDAGVAFRQAAIDGTNPAPAGALASLGDCFVELNRPEDAIEAYRTALDFAGPRDDARAINAGLGCAYVAANRFTDALDAFNTATADGIYRLTDAQKAAFDHARETLDANRALAPENTGNGYVNGVDPLDPLGKSGSFMPDPSDTGFFTLSESEMVQQDKKKQKIRRKHRHTGLKIFLVIFVLVLALAGVGAYAFTQGFGYPSQQDTLTKLFQAASDGSDASSCLASNMSESAKSVLVSSIPADATPTIEGLDSSMTTSKATVKVALAKGGEMKFEVDFARQGLGWVVTSMTPDLGSTATAQDAASTESGGNGAGTADAATAGTDTAEQTPPAPAAGADEAAAQ